LSTWSRTLLTTLACLLCACGNAPEPASAALESTASLRPSDASTSLDDPDLAACARIDLHETPPEHHPLCLERLLDAFERALTERWTEGAELVATTVWLEQATRGIARQNLSFLAARAIHAGPDWDQAAARFGDGMQRYRRLILSHPLILQGVAADHQALNDGTAPQDRRLIEQSWQALKRSGAFLEPAARQRLDNIERDLATLESLFNENLSHATLDFERHFLDPTRLAGLPGTSLEQARQDALDRGHREGWVLTLKTHRLIPAMRHLHDRELRRQLYLAWQWRAGGRRVGQRGDNPELMRRILSLRLDRARLLGYADALAHTLDDSSLRSRPRLLNMLDELESAARPVAEAELEQIRALLREDGIDAEPRAWDFHYYQARLQDSANGRTEFQPAAASTQVIDEIFRLSQVLWGLQFEPLNDTAATDGVFGYDVREGGQHRGRIHFDLHHRTGKRGGAWMSVLEHAHHSPDRHPAEVWLQMNVQARPDRPALLDRAQIETLFHEYGHALMEILSDVRHRSLAGNQLPFDAIEFPALLFERLAFESDALNGSEHEVRPRLGHGAGLPALQLLREIARVRLDLAWHTITRTGNLDPMAIEAEVIEAMDLPPVISPQQADDGYRAVFGTDRGGLAYRGLWANVLAADVASWWDRHGDRERPAEQLRSEVLSRGNGRDLGVSIETLLGREVSTLALRCELGLQACPHSGPAGLSASSP
jgi:peptidyl-dipeptidase Dcp